MLSLAGTNEPTAAEQLFLAEINQARANPAAEGQRLVSLAQSDPVLQVATSGWNMNAFLTEISAIPPEPPLAFNTGLIEAARAHSASMLAQNLQFHSPSGYLTNPSVATAGNGQPYYPTGYGNWATGENIFAYSGTVNSANLSDYVNYFAAAFLIDWGNPDFGHLTNELAPGPGQWNASNPHYPFSEIGIGLLSNVSSPNATSTGPNVGPAIATEEFGWRAGNPILTGVFYNDNDGSGRYGIGEGIGGVTIRAVGQERQGTFVTTTWASGGYSLPLPSGSYAITASGGGLSSPVSKTVALGQDNVEWDGAIRSTPADQPVPGDYSGNGQGELAVYRPSTGQWFINGNPTPIDFGGVGGVDIPVPGNYDAGRPTEFALYRSTTSEWFVMGANGVGRSLGVFGSPGYDIPVPGNYHGTGLTEPGLYRPSTGQWFAMGSDGVGHLLTNLGEPGVDIPVPGNYDGVGYTEAAVYRPTTGQWFVNGPNGGHQVAQLGVPGLDIPVPGNYDGTGKTEPAVYRPSTGEWFILGADGTVRTLVFGGAHLDVPLATNLLGNGHDPPARDRPTTGQWFIHNPADGSNLTKQFGQGGSSCPISDWLAEYRHSPSPRISLALIYPQAVEAGPGVTVSSSKTAPSINAEQTIPAPAPYTPLNLLQMVRRQRARHHHHSKQRAS